MATSSQEFVCIAGRGKKVRKEDLTSWCNCFFPSPGVKISESNFILTAQLEGLCFLVISQQQFLTSERGQAPKLEFDPVLCSLQGDHALTKQVSAGARWL